MLFYTSLDFNTTVKYLCLMHKPSGIASGFVNDVELLTSLSSLVKHLTLFSTLRIRTGPEVFENV